MPVRNINAENYFPASSIRTYDTGVTETVSGNGSYKGYEHITTVTPNYFQKKQNGEYLGNNPLRWAKSYWQANSGAFEYRYGTNLSRWIQRSGNYCFGNFIGDPWDYLTPTAAQWSSLYAQADSRVLQRLKNSKVNLAVAMAEGHQTASMITKTATRIAKAGLALRSGSYGNAVKQLGAHRNVRKEGRFSKLYPSNPSLAFANGWLELMYGWLPLLSDIYGAAEHLAYRNERREKASAKASDNMASSPSVYSSADMCTKTGSARTTISVVTTVHYSLTMSVLSEMSQLGFTNPLEVAWEVIPYSFIVDWFLPIGTFVSNMDASFGKTYLGGTRTEIWDQTTESRVTGVGVQGSIAYIGSASGGYRRRRRVIMAPASGFPTNPIPRIQNPFSPLHGANALALLRQAFKP